MLMKEIKENIRKWRDILCSWIGIVKVVKMSILPELIHRFNTIAIRIPADFLQIGIRLSKTYIEMQTNQNRQNNFEKEE